MKIVFLADSGSIHTLKWVNSLSERGHNIALITINPIYPEVAHLEKNIKLYQLGVSGKKGYYLNMLELRRLLQRIKPDIINAHYASGYGTLARIAGCKPLILNVWGSDVFNFPFESVIKKRILIKNLRYADVIASTSSVMAEHTKQLLGDIDMDIPVTPFGVDLKLFDICKYKKKTEDKIVLGNVKTLAPKYGITYIIQAFEKLYSRFMNEGEIDLANRLELHIYGEGPQYQEIVELIDILGFNDRVFLFGRIPNAEVPKALSTMDIFCLGSIEESFGVAAVEAMAMELPVVATDVSGFREVVDNEETGILVKTKDIDEMALSLRRLILDKELRQRMGKNGRNKVIRMYNWDDNVKKMEEIYGATLCR